MYTKLLGITLTILIGLPTIAFGSSVAVSMAEGKTPAEAVSTFTKQLNNFFSRVETIEQDQKEITERLDTLEQEQETSKPAKPESGQVPTPQIEHKIYTFTFDTETEALCTKALQEEVPETESLIGQIAELCEELPQEEYFSLEGKEDFDRAVETLHDKWRIYVKIKRAEGREVE